MVETKLDTERLMGLIRDVPDYPKKGVVFRDITTLIKDGEAFDEVINIFYEKCKDKRVDLVAAVESRGFIFGGALANKLRIGFVPIRKFGKLPADTVVEKYDLEYGTDTLEIHKDAVLPGQSVLIIDDLLATGGTIQAACKLVEKLGGSVVGILVMIELGFLKGREKLKNYDLFTLINYDQE
ncbi:MAG: adenine phosphoribosyltransferase [candidate division Zixibacteria bacterium SM1_73]|nr:MAG: adenine phosphoribosyltransferase [candidate division Zixibacteria bacterium SM1_73]